VSKPTLGRGLGDLLGNTDRTKEPAAPRQSGVGLRILIEGSLRETEATHVVEQTSESATANAKPEILEAKKEITGELLTSSIAIIALIGADVALIGWVAHYTFTHRHALSWSGTVGCVVTTLVAAFCGCVAASIIARRK